MEERGRQRVYSLSLHPLTELDSWLEPYRDLWSHRMDALHTEIARGKRASNQTTSEEASS